MFAAILHSKVVVVIVVAIERRDTNWCELVRESSREGLITTIIATIIMISNKQKIIIIITVPDRNQVDHNYFYPKIKQCLVVVVVTAVDVFDSIVVDIIVLMIINIY